MVKEFAVPATRAEIVIELEAKSKLPPPVISGVELIESSR